MVSLALQQLVLKKIMENLKQVNHYFQQQYPVPKIEYTQRGKIAGTAHYLKWMIRLNPTLLLENGESFINEVVPHELAHLIVFKNNGRMRPHGKEWQLIMRNIFKLEPKTRHHFPTDSLQGKLFNYICLCRPHQLTLIRHNKMQRKIITYYCKYCKSPLTYEISS